VYNYDPAKKTVVKVNKNAGGLSTAPNELEGKYAIGWARNIWSDMLT
jgi:sulfide dehydrogenase [flavocytochrome c] flavoprotein chain